MKIHPLNTSDKNNYDELCKEYGTIFQQRQWIELFPDSEIYGLFDKKNQIIGGFGLQEKKFLGFRFLSNPPYTPSIGPWYITNRKSPFREAEFERNLISKFSEFIEAYNAGIKSVILSYEIPDVLPFIWKNFKVTPQYTYLINLDITTKEIWDGFSSDKRNLIRKAEKDQISVEKITDYQSVMEMLKKTYERKGIKDTYNQLNSILFDFANSTNSFAYGAYLNNKIITVAFCVFDQKKAYYLLGGHDPENKHNGAGAAVIWESIKEAKRLNLECFDFEGSMIPQIEKFFKGFGGKLTSAFRINKAYFPIEIILKVFKRNLF